MSRMCNMRSLSVDFETNLCPNITLNEMIDIVIKVYKFVLKKLSSNNKKIVLIGNNSWNYIKTTNINAMLLYFNKYLL